MNRHARGPNSTFLLCSVIIGLALLIGVGIALMAGGGGLALPFSSTDLPTPFPSPTASPTSRPTSTTTPTSPPPTPTRTPTATPVPTAAATVTPSPPSSVVTDAQGDLVDYETLAPVNLTVAGADVEASCFDATGRLVDTVPQEIMEQMGDDAAEENLLLWTTLHAPVPVTVTQLTYWLFALDTDAELATGRPVGDGAINPDLGAEVTAGVYCDPGNDIQFQPYLLVWDVAAEDMVRHTFAADVTFTPDRRTIILALPREPLTQVLTEVAQVEPRWEGALGRAATLAGTESGLVVDFCPDLPGN